MNTVIYNPEQASQTTISLKCNNNENTATLMPHKLNLNQVITILRNQATIKQNVRTSE